MTLLQQARECYAQAVGSISALNLLEARLALKGPIDRDVLEQICFERRHYMDMRDLAKSAIHRIVMDTVEAGND